MEVDNTTLTFYPKVFMFGDSLTQGGFHDGGWCSKLVEDYQRKCDFINRGFSGYTTRMSKMILISLLTASYFPKGSLHAAVVFFGTNDSVMRDKDDRAVPIEEYEENLRQIVNELVNFGISKERLLIISPSPIDEAHWEEAALAMGIQPSFSNQRVAQYAEACTQISKELGVQNLNLWKEMDTLQNWSSLLMDGVHFGKTGHEFVYLKVKEKLDVILQDLKMVYPDWKTVDHIHPEKSFKKY